MNRERGQTKWHPMSHFSHPPEWCSLVCAKSMSNDCLGECAPNRNTSYFNLLDSVRTLHDLPRFNLDTWLDDLTPMERQVIAGLYISKIADLLMGYKDDRETESEKVLNRIEELFAGDNDSSGNG